MRLIAVYCVLVAIGEVLAFGLGLIVERTIPQFSMLLYMAMFFGVLWGFWPIAVYVTERFLPSADDGTARRAVRP